MNEQMEFVGQRHDEHEGPRGPPESIEWKQQEEANIMAEKNACELMVENEKDVEEHPFEFNM